MSLGERVQYTAPRYWAALRRPRRLSIERTRSAIDGLLIIGLCILSGTAYQWVEYQRFEDIGKLAAIGSLIAAIFCGLARILDTSQPLKASPVTGQIQNTIVAWTITFLFLSFIVFVLKLEENFSRGAMLVLFLVGIPVLTASRSLVPKRLTSFLNARDRQDRAIILLTTDEDTFLSGFGNEMGPRLKIYQVRVDGFCDQARWPATRNTVVDQVYRAARLAGPSDLYVSSEGLSHDRIVDLLAGLRLFPGACFLIPDKALAQFLGYAVRPIGRNIALEVQTAPMGGMSRVMKRCLDLLISAIVLLFLLPLFVAIGFAIKADSSGPVFFRQRRNGLGGRIFRIYKFRSMSVLEDGADLTQAQPNDERVTRVGRWLRRSSLDELPQLINVLRGEMSLVGPRPHALAHDDLYKTLIENYELRQHVKPGITGWAQINGLRGETRDIELMNRRIEFDLWYAANCSVSLDIAILLRTPFVIWFQENAY